MLKEALNELQKLITQGVTPQSINLGTKKQVGQVVNGEIHVYNNDVPTSLYKVATLESFARAFTTYKKYDSSVWVGEDRIRGILNEEPFNDDRVIMDVSLSHLFNAIENLKSVQCRDGSPTLALIRYFNDDLYPSLVTPENFLDALRQIKFESSDATDVRHSGKADSISKSVAAKTSGTSELPLEINLEFEPYPCLHGELEKSVYIACRVTVDTIGQKISVRALPGEIEEAKREAMLALVAKLQEMLPDDATKIFCGGSGVRRD